MNASDTSFDLITEPWVLVRPLGGGVAEVPLREVFARADEFTGLSGDLPTQVFAMMRLLLAVLHDAVDGPDDLDAWERLWATDGLPVDAIGSYLDRHRERFDLFHPSTPFFQVHDLRTAKDEVSELSKLIADVPNGHRFFTSRHGSLTLSFAEAARWVVHCHAFDPSGIKSGAVGDPRVSGGRGYPIGTGWCGFLGGVLVEGRTLRETLLLNLIPRDFPGAGRRSAEDLPAWRREPVDARPSEREPDGPVDLFTWQSRRIRLSATGGTVTGALICNGDPLTQQNRHRVETHSAWRRSEAQEKKARSTLPIYMPKSHDPERAIWRGLESLLPQERASGSAYLAPTVLEWQAALTTDRILDPDTLVRLHTIGMSYGSNNSVTDDVVDDVLDIRAVLLAQGASELRAMVFHCARDAEQGAAALGTLAGNLARAIGGDPEGPRARARETAYAALDPLFRHWISELTSTSDQDASRALWDTTGHRAVLALGEVLVAAVSPLAYTGRTVKFGSSSRLVTAAHAHQWFHDDLDKAFFHATAPASSTPNASTMSTPTQKPNLPPPPELTPVGKVVSGRIATLQHGYRNDNSAAVAALARLRRGVGKPPGSVVDILEYTLDEKFLDGVADSTDATVAEHAAHIALTLYATHQQSKSDAMHVRGPGLGRAMRRLIRDWKNIADDPLTRRLTMLCTTESLDEFTHHLRAVVQLLRREHVPLDYGLLADQLVTWQTDGPAALRLVWSRDYHLSPKNS